MTLQFGFTAELANTGYAPLAALLNYYQGEKVLDPLQSTLTSDENKLIQVILSILSGCETMSMVNTRLRPERVWAQVNRIEYFADQSTLSRYLNGLTQMNLAHLARAVGQVGHRCSRTDRHDWRGFLLIDFDLSGLPCGKQAEGGQKGYFSGKKTSMAANWPAPVRSSTKKPCGQSSLRATI